MKKIIALILVIFTFATTVLADGMYVSSKEVAAPDTWAAGEVEEAKKNGLLTENIPKYYKLDINRFEFAELIVTCIEKTLGKTVLSAPASTFTDTDEASVLKAYNIGVVKGVGNNMYAPDREITRQEIAAMMYRAICYIESEKGVNIINKNANIDKFSDKADVSDWAVESVAVLAENGVMKGTSDTTLSPLNNTTVQEAILLDLRIYKLFNA